MVGDVSGGGSGSALVGLDAGLGRLLGSGAKIIKIDNIMKKSFRMG